MVEPSEGPLDAGVARRVLADGTRDTLIREEPLWIDVAGQRVLTMRTPGDDRNLAVGFLLSEGAIPNAEAVTGCVELAGSPAELRPDTVTLHVDAPLEPLRARLTRTHEVRSSCGICGVANPEELLDDLPPLLPGVPRLTAATIQELRQRFEARQPLFRATGASHAAALFDATGTELGHGEDVGRHNALDKAIGAAAGAGHDLARAVAMLSGRAGFDLVLKCLRVRVPVILSVSAPSAQSHDLCRAADATLIGFVRPGRLKVYTAGGRLAD